MTLTEFDTIVSQAAQTKSSSILRNASKDRAVIVMSNIFKTAKDSINIFANQFESEICEDQKYLMGLEDVINRGVKINILFSETPVLNSKAVQLINNLEDNKKKLVSLKKLSSKASDYILNLKVNNGHSFHFAVADHRMYRFEIDTNDNQAYFSFNDRDNAKKLENIFDTTWSLSSSL